MKRHFDLKFVKALDVLLSEMASISELSLTPSLSFTIYHNDRLKLWFPSRELSRTMLFVISILGTLVHCCDFR